MAYSCGTCIFRTMQRTCLHIMNDRHFQLGIKYRFIHSIILRHGTYMKQPRAAQKCSCNLFCSEISLTASSNHDLTLGMFYQLFTNPTLSWSVLIDDSIALNLSLMSMPALSFRACWVVSSCCFRVRFSCWREFTLRERKIKKKN